MDNTFVANPEHLAILEQGVAVWNQWRRETEPRANITCAELRDADLSGADLSDADLTLADFRQAYLSRADLLRANLSDADLSLADLREAYLSGANLLRANLTKTDLIAADLSLADLRDADLSGADLVGANLRGADLRGANLRGARLLRADLIEVDLSGARLNGADLTLARFVRTNLTRADLTGCNVYGIAAWELELEQATQSNLVITRPDFLSGKPEQLITVDDLEVAHLIYLLLNRRKLRNVITTLGEKAVLILGRFTERKKLLDAIADKLRALGYLPIVFDFENPTDRDVTETVKILAGLSKFVIADVTNPRSVPLELQATIPDYMVPFVTILQRGQPAFSMFDDLPRKYHWALPLLKYNDPDTLLSAFEQKVVVPALEKVAEVRRRKAEPVPERSAEDDR